MIVHGHAHQLSSLDELPSNADILARRLRIAAWVLMSQDDRGGVGQDGDLEDLTRFHDGGGEASDANLGQTRDDVRRVQEDN